MSMLNIGPEKHAAIAIVGCPERAITTSATRSPTEFPHASTVMPKIDGDMPMMMPSVCRHARSSAAAMEIHTMEAANERVRVFFLRWSG